MEDEMFQVSDWHWAKVVPMRLVRGRERQEMLRIDSEGSFWQPEEGGVNNAKPACANQT